MTLMEKMAHNEPITDIEIQTATNEELVIMLTQLPLMINNQNNNDELFKRIKSVTLTKLNEDKGLTHLELMEVIDNSKDISKKAKDGLKKALLIVKVFNTHEKLYNQMRYKDDKTTL